MINITEINNRLVQQDEVLRARLAEVAARIEGDSATSALIEVLSESLAAIHERQGNLILLMLQTNT